MVAASRDDESSVGYEAAPWDPIWEYVFGAGSVDDDGGGDDDMSSIPESYISSKMNNSRNSRRQNVEEASETTESFLDYILPSEAKKSSSRASKYNLRGQQQQQQQASFGNSTNNKNTGKERKSGIFRRTSNKNQDSSSSVHSSVPSFEMSFLSSDDRNEASSRRDGGGGSDKRLGFWRRNSNNNNGSGSSNKGSIRAKGNEGDQDSMLSFLDQPYEIDEHEYSRQQHKKERRQMAQQRKEQKTNKLYKQQQQQQQQGRARRRRNNKDDDSWVSALSSSFDDGFAPFRGKQQKRKGIFPWRGKQQKGGGRGDDSGSMYGEPWTQLKERAEAEAARSRGDTESEGDTTAPGVFSFNKIAGALLSEDSSSGEREDGSASYLSVGSSSFGSDSYRSEETSSILGSIVTEEDGSVAASYSVDSVSIQQDRPVESRRSTPGRAASAPPQTSEVRLSYDPTDYNTTGPSLNTIQEDGSQDQELSTFNSESRMIADDDGGDDDDGLCESFEESMKQFPSPGPKSPVSNLSMDEGSLAGSLSRFFLPQNRLGKVACCRLKDLGEEAERFTRETGIPVHELSKQELETLFPKLRSISEDVNASRSRSTVIGNSLSFEKDLPAHLQAIVAENGPQSLYEYEFEKGTHKVLVYERFGNDPRTMLSIISSDEPPQLIDNGQVDNSKVIIQVEASTVSRTDCYVREGQWMGNGYIPLPNSPGADMVGKIYRIDKQSEQKLGLCVGDRVMSLTKYGGNARYLGIDADQLVKVPESIDPAEAACLAETYLTAFQCLHYGQSPGLRYRRGSLKAKSVLILGSMSSTMGRAVSQLSTLAAVDNVYATSKPRHYQRLTSIGILPLSNDPLDWFERLQGRIDLIISFDEEVSPLLQKILSSNGGILVVTQTGFDPDKEQAQFDKKSRLACGRNEGHHTRRLHAYNAHNEWDENLYRCKKDLEHLVELLEATWIVPHILDRIPLSKVARAHEIIGVKNVPGFIVCEPWLVSKSRAVLL